MCLVLDSQDGIFDSAESFLAKGRRGDDSCGQKGSIDGEGEGKAQVAEGAAAEVGSERRRDRVQELVHRVERGVRWLPVNQWDIFQDSL